MVLRPDEEAAEAAIERDRNTRSYAGKAASFATTVAATAGTGLTARLMPFLNQYIPADLAMKGISKISPKLGNFLKAGAAQGLNLKEGLNFVKEQIEPKKEAAKESRNIIEQYSPELHQFIDQQVKAGLQPIQAGAVAQNKKEFADIIKKLSKEHKTPWSNIIESVYGASQAAQPMQQQMPQDMQQAPGQRQISPAMQQYASKLDNIERMLGGQ